MQRQAVGLLTFSGRFLLPLNGYMAPAASEGAGSGGHLCEAEARTEPAGETPGTYFAVIAFKLFRGLIHQFTIASE